MTGRDRTRRSWGRRAALCATTGVLAASMLGGPGSLVARSATITTATPQTAWSWGDNSNGQLGDGTQTDRSTPSTVRWSPADGPLGPDLADVAVGAPYGVSLALKADGSTVWAWGDNTWGAVYPGAPCVGIGGPYEQAGTACTVPVQVQGLPSGHTFVSVAGGPYDSAAVDADGSVWFWGWGGGWGANDPANDPDYRSQTGPTTGLVPGLAAQHIDVKQISLSWGSDRFISEGAGQEVRSGGGAAVDRAGQVWTFMTRNAFGERGGGVYCQDGCALGYFDVSHVQFPAGVTLTAVAAGGGHMLALDSLGRVWAWGDDDYGQLGTGTTGVQKCRYSVGQQGPTYVLCSPTPLLVPGLSGVTAIAAGRLHSLALTASGDVWAWGDNQLGELGLGDTTPDHVDTPHRVATLSGAGCPTSASPSVCAPISAGGFDSVVLRTDGTVEGWGLDSTGQLGDGTTGSTTYPDTVCRGDYSHCSPVPCYCQPAPVQAKGLAGALAVASGGGSTLALAPALSIPPPPGLPITDPPPLPPLPTLPALPTLPTLPSLPSPPPLPTVTGPGGGNPPGGGGPPPPPAQLVNSGPGGSGQTGLGGSGGGGSPPSVGGGSSAPVQVHQPVGAAGGAMHPAAAPQVASSAPVAAPAAAPAPPVAAPVPAPFVNPVVNPVLGVVQQEDARAAEEFAMVRRSPDALPSPVGVLAGAMAGTLALCLALRRRREEDEPEGCAIVCGDGRGSTAACRGLPGAAPW